MAFPYVSEAGFELGTRGHFDAETDTETRLDFPHYTDLAAIPGLPAPYRGAYCMRVNLANDGSPADAYVQETGSWDMTAGSADLDLRLYFFLSADVVMANSDEFAIMQFWSGTSDVEAGAYINYTTANGYRIGIGATSASSFKPLTLGEWHCLELFFDPAGGAAGALDGRLDGNSFTQVGSLTNADITSGVVGVMGQDAGTTRGVLLIDEVTTDDARLGPFASRWPHQLVMTSSGHAFVGPGTVSVVELMSGAGTDNVVTLFDTDVGATTEATNFVEELKNTANSQRVPYEGKPLRFKRGCYVSMSGTNPRAMLKIESTKAYFSDGSIRTYGLKRTAHPLGL